MYEIVFFRNSIHDAVKLSGSFHTREEAVAEIRSRSKRFGSEVIALDYDDVEDGADALVRMGSVTIQYAVNRKKATK